MICQLDRSNLANAYVSGMKTDLGFSGNQFNVVNTVFTVGYTHPITITTTCSCIYICVCGSSC